MKVGLVVGKFAPLHNGHVYLIESALKQVDKLVILCYSNPDLGFSFQMKMKWLTEMFPTCKILVPDDKFVPHNSASEYAHREFCCNLLNDENILPDVIFTSEDYGDGFAKHTSEFFRKNVVHVCIDIQRTAYNVSATKIRSIFSNNLGINTSNKDDFDFLKNYLPLNVLLDCLTRKIVIYGGESTGKTSLCEKLSREYRLPMIKEYGREHWEFKNGNLSLFDLNTIVGTQIALELKMKNAMICDFFSYKNIHSYMICDTSPLTTLWYALSMFKDEFKDSFLDISFFGTKAKYDYNLTFLCAPDFEFVQDGTRKDDAFRMAGHQWYLKNIESAFQILFGSIQDRASSVMKRLTT